VEAAIAGRPHRWMIRGGRHLWGGLMLEIDAEVREAGEGWQGGKMEEAGKEELLASTMPMG
jgi:hypothetical protein